MFYGVAAKASDHITHLGSWQVPPTHLVEGKSFAKLLTSVTAGHRTCDSQFIEILFPDDRLPVDIRHPDLIRDLTTYTLWDPVGSHLVIPDLSKEENISTFFNSIGKIMGEFNKDHPIRRGVPTKRQRFWHPLTKNAKPRGYHIDRRPDVVCVDRGDDDCRSWAGISSFCEITSEQRVTSRMISTTAAKTYILHATQPHRRFTFSISFRYLNHDATLFCTYADRSGFILSTGFPICGSGRWGSLCLLRILAFLMFGSEADIGFDPSVTINKSTSDASSIVFDNTTYQVLKTIYSKPSLIGRATKVWLTAHQGVHYVVKDSWIASCRKSREHDLLCHIKEYCDSRGISVVDQHLPLIHAGGDVLIDGHVDSTEMARQLFFDDLAVYRVHRRLILETVGVELCNFASAREFLFAVIGAIKGHQFLCEKLHILHRDVSASNILILRGSNHLDSRGILTDLDCASYMSLDNQEIQDDTRSGTPPFMALAILAAHDIVTHLPCHDLESFVYVIIYIWTYFTSPGKHAVVKQDWSVVSWFDMKQPMEQTFNVKSNSMRFPNTTIITNIAPYWARFNGILCHIIRKAHPVSTPTNPTEDPLLLNNLTHDYLITELQSCLALVPSGSEVTDASTGLKRKGDKEGANVVNCSKRRKATLSVSLPVPESYDVRPWSTPASSVASEDAFDSIDSQVVDSEVS